MDDNRDSTAIVYCEDQLCKLDGKTAAGLVRHSEKYEILGVIDSSLAGKDAGEVLDNTHQNIPIFSSLDHALKELPTAPQHFIYGKAPLEATLANEERLLIKEAIKKGLNIVSGLHEFLTDDPEFTTLAKQYGVTITDVRKAPPLKDLHVYSGKTSSVKVPVVAVLGTDCAVGKMTTLIELHKALRNRNIRSEIIATGQTAMMQGARYGISIDSLASQFVIGEIERAVLEANSNESPDIILVEGQSSVSHPAFMSSIGILKGANPDAVILQHAPGRKNRCDFPELSMPEVKDEIKLIQSLSPTKVIALCLSHEDLSPGSVESFVQDFEIRLHMPVTDVLTMGCQKLLKTLAKHFPELGLNRVVKPDINQGPPRIIRCS